MMGRSDDGSDAYIGGNSNEQPEHPVRVSPFWLDKFEVTVGRFRRFVDSYTPDSIPKTGDGAHPSNGSSGWEADWNSSMPKDGADFKQKLISHYDGCDDNFHTWTPASGMSECLPINCIDFYTAFAFCIWDGGRLATEAEWEFAAAGGEKNLMYPWGSAAPDNEHAVFDCTATGSSSCTPADIRPIGSKSPLGDGSFGHADLAGSMLEHVRDVMDQNYYKENPPNKLLTDPIDLAFDGTAVNNVVRGGSYQDSAALLRSAARFGNARSNHLDNVGFRCARNP
jgi:formylglycine-generating enzyme required for sulfatase activity